MTRAKQEALSRGVRAGATRNRELELLRGIAHTLLDFRSPDELFKQVAQVSRRLLRSEGGAVFLVSEGEGLRVVAADGLLEPAEGRVIPVSGSLAGWVVTNGQPVRTEDMTADPRNHPVLGLPPELKSAIVIPLQSKASVIGALGAYNRTEGEPFSEYDIELLQALGDQVVLGLDRSAVLEESRRRGVQLEAANRDLVEATRLKSQFLANMSHELRTPLNAIIGFSDLILADGGELSEMHRDYLESVLRNGRHLLDLINSVLDVAKLEAGRMPIRLSRFDIHQAVRGSIDDTESLRAIKRQKSIVEMAHGVFDIVADPRQVRQILLNLLSNASKFTEEGGTITISVSRTRVPLSIPADRAADIVRYDVRDAVLIAVRDTGIGISKDEIGRLFQAFSQVDASTSRQQSGTGLGLVLAKQLVELHGGTIGVDSAAGEGSTFWFILPVDGPVRRSADSA